MKKSTAKQKLAGNPGKRTPKKKRQVGATEKRITQAFENVVLQSIEQGDGTEVAAPSGEATDCPQWLPPAAKAEWTRAVALLKEPLQPRDVAALACYCQSVADLQWASKALEKQGRVIVNTNGTISQHPAVKLAAAAMTRIKQFAGEFGFTPAARSRVPDPPKVEADEFGDFLAAPPR